MRVMRGPCILLSFITVSAHTKTKKSLLVIYIHFSENVFFTYPSLGRAMGHRVSHGTASLEHKGLRALFNSGSLVVFGLECVTI